MAFPKEKNEGTAHLSLNCSICVCPYSVKENDTERQGTARNDTGIKSTQDRLKMNKQPEQIFKTPNKAGRPKGSPNKRTVIREALQETFADGEKGFWLAVATQAAGGDLQAMAMLADRLYPKMKPQGETITLSKPLDGSLADNARTILELVAGGEIAPDTAKELLSALADVGKIIEVSELQKRLERLEAIHEQKHTTKR